MKHLTFIGWVSLILVIIGGINWGLFGVFNIDLVRHFLGGMTLAARLTYVAIGLSAVYLLFKIISSRRP